MLCLNFLQPRISWNVPKETTLFIRVGNGRNEFFNGLHEGVRITKNSANISVVETWQNGVRNVLTFVLIHEHLIEIKVGVSLVERDTCFAELVLNVCWIYPDISSRFPCCSRFPEYQNRAGGAVRELDSYTNF